MPPLLAAALMFGLAVVLALISGPRRGWHGEPVGWLPFAILFGVAFVVIGLIIWLKGPGDPPAEPAPEPARRNLRDMWTAGIAVLLIVLIGMRACGKG